MTQEQIIEKINKTIEPRWYVYGSIEELLDEYQDTLSHLAISEEDKTFYAWGKKRIYFLVKVNRSQDDPDYYFDSLPLSPEYCDDNEPLDVQGEYY